MNPYVIELADWLQRLQSAKESMVLTESSEKYAPSRRPGEDWLDYFRRHEAANREAVTELMLAWWSGDGLPENLSPDCRLWGKARFEFAFWLLRSMASPSREGILFLPLESNSQGATILDRYLVSWCLIEAWEQSGAEQWARTFDMLRNPLGALPGWDAGAE